MSRFTLVALGALTLAGCGTRGGVPEVSEWKAYTTQDGLLSVKFPKEPKIETKPVPLPTGMITARVAMYEGRSIAFAANSMVFPDGVAGFDAQAALRGGVDGMASNVNGKVMSEKDVTLNGLSGKEVLVKLDNGIYIRAQMYVDAENPALFQLQVLARSKSLVTGDAGDDFLGTAVIHKK